MHNNSQLFKCRILLVFFCVPKGRSGPKSEAKVQDKAHVLSHLAVEISAARVVQGLVKVAVVAALLGCIQEGFCCSSAVWVVVDQAVAA